MISSLVVLIVSISCIQLASAQVISLSAADQQAAVDAHNQIRIAAGATAMQKLEWNDALAQFAQNTASQCDFDHTSSDARSNVAGFSYIGENIYTVAGDMAQPTIKDAVTDWASEGADYDLNSNSCSGDTCLHYTQLVWAATTDVGCAISACSSIQDFSSDHGFLVFCNYGIGGNIIGEAPYVQASSSSEVGSKCQQTFKENADSTGLCVSDGTAQSQSGTDGSQTTQAITTTVANAATTVASVPADNESHKHEKGHIHPRQTRNV